MSLTPVVSLLSLMSGLLLPTPVVFDKNPLLITTAYGQVKGYRNTGTKGTEFCSFEGIPYAKPPIGNLRFKDPQLPDKWSKTFITPFEGRSCPGIDQINGNTIDLKSNEDCLQLNVFAKNPNTNRRAPVMVFIYGGGFIQGSSDTEKYGPDLFMQKNVVLVTFNYRIGALGFLSIDDAGYGIPGNAGLKDQAFALLWVKQNIARFGGDPDNVTLFGNSAGAASIHYHMMSEYSKGLFHKAIIQSGSAFNPWASNDDITLNERLALKLGWNGVGGTAGVMRTLMAATATEIVYAQRIVSVVEAQRGDLFLFVPRVEPYNNGSCLISTSIEEINNNAWGNDLPLIIGGNRDEGYLYFFDFIKKANVIGDPSTYFQNALPKELDLTTVQRQILGNELRTFYFGDSEITRSNIDKGLVPLLTDKLFWHGLEAIVRNRLKRSDTKPTYLYLFSFDSYVTVLLELAIAGSFVKGTVHSAELLYMFYFLGQNGHFSDSSKEGRVSSTFINAWTQFAATGNPNGNDSTVVYWEPVQQNNAPLKCYRIDEQNAFTDLPESKRIDFWNHLNSFA